MALEYEFLIQDSETQKIYDLSSVIDGDINYISEMQNGAAKLTFNYIDKHMFPNGSVARFKYNKSDIFYGYIFNVSNTRGKNAVTAYDSLRYFKYKDTKIYVVSVDLPFAQARWCGAEDVDNVITLSDYKDRSFGENYGVYIEEVGFLARAVFVVDEDNKVIYTEYCENVSDHPNYDKVLKVLDNLSK